MKRCALMVPAIAVLAFSAESAALASDAEQIVEELRQRGQAVETFEVRMTVRRVVDGEPVVAGRELLLGRRFKAPDHFRATAWYEDGEVAHDLTRVEGTTTSHHLRDGRASITDFAPDPGEHIVFEPYLFPLLLARVFDRAELVEVAADEAAGELTLRWEAPDAYPMHRHILATFALQAPHEPLSVTYHDAEAGSVWHVDLSGHREEGPPVPTEARFLRMTEAGDVTAEHLITFVEITINEPMPDSAFEIDLPPGTRVTDYNLRHTFVVGEEGGASE